MGSEKYNLSDYITTDGKITCKSSNPSVVKISGNKFIAKKAGKATLTISAKQGKNYLAYKPIHDEHKQIRWKGKQEKYAEAHRAELTLWDAANRYLHANLPKGTKTLPIAEWEQEYADLKTQRDSDYTKLKDTRAEVAELQKIRRCVDIALRADQPEQMQSRTKRHEQER